ncbi:MAG: methyltransferase domain-containing protein [Pirellulaceae bacterium]
MFELCCTVRDCHRVLRAEGTSLRCAAGHHFDRSKDGYWTLLQPQHRKSLNAGDADVAVLARHRWLRNGRADGFIATLRSWIEPLPRALEKSLRRTIDLGCGDGSIAPRLFPEDASSFCGIDLSRRGLKLAARGWPTATWVMANADRMLPVADASVDRVVSLFGRRPIEEMYRTLCDEGHCIVAVPGEDDLIELRERMQQEGRRRKRSTAIVDQMTQCGFRCVETHDWRERVQLDREGIDDALAMTYRGVRHSQKSRLEGVESMETTLAADVMLFVKPLRSSRQNRGLH